MLVMPAKMMQTTADSNSLGDPFYNSFPDHSWKLQDRDVIMEHPSKDCGMEAFGLCTAASPPIHCVTMKFRNFVLVPYVPMVWSRDKL